MTKYPTQESKIRRQKHVANMSHEAMKNIYELGYPFGYFKASCQFAIETPIGVIDYFGINGTWVVRKGQDRGKNIRKMKQYIKNYSFRPARCRCVRRYVSLYKIFKHC